VSCKPRAAAPTPTGAKGDKKKGAADKSGVPMDLFDVVLADTVLFPEGVSNQ